MNIIIEVTRDAGCEDLPLPSYQTEGSAGMDLCAAVESAVIVQPGATLMIPTGLRIAVPPGYEAQVRPRSGIALKHSIGVPNAPGTIDSDYRGPVNVILINWGKAPFTVNRGDRIAQMVVAKVERAEWAEVQALSDTARGTGGFGHTGIA